MDENRVFSVVMVVAFALFIIPALIAYYFLVQAPAGYIISQGGNVTAVNIPIPTADVWKAVYGNLSIVNQDQYLNLNSTNATILTFNPKLPRCNNVELYASEAIIMDWTQVTSAQPSELDSYLGISQGLPYSGDRVFTQFRSYNVNGREQLAYATQTNGINHSYSLGLLKYNGQLVFVTNTDLISQSFDGKQADYQLMLPIPLNQTRTYYFFLDSTDTSNCASYNKQPSMSFSFYQDGYVGVPFSLSATATDLDSDSMAFWSSPSLGWNTMNWQRSSPTSYSGSMSFVPTAAQAGRNVFYVYASDAKSFAKGQVIVRIGYCGDFDDANMPKCESDHEDCRSCPADCGACPPDEPEELVIATNTTEYCAGQKILAGVYSPYEACTGEGIQVFRRKVCGYISGTDVKLYRVKPSGRILIENSLNKGSAEFSFSIAQPGNYLLYTKKDGYRAFRKYIEIINCTQAEKKQRPQLPDEEKPIVIPPVEPEKPQKPEINVSFPTQWLILYYAVLIFGTFLFIYMHKKRMFFWQKQNSPAAD